MNTLISKLRTLAVTAAAGYFLAFSSTSSAAAFQVTFDPYTELYGTAIFNVQDSCLANDGSYNDFWELLALALNGCYITFEGAHISTDGIGGPYTDYEAIFPLVIFTNLLVVDNQLAGITTLIILEPVGAEELAALTVQSSSFVHECHETLLFTAPNANNPAGGVRFTGCGSDGRPLPALTGNVISIVQLPEPGTLALLFGAGIAGWWVRRRRLAAS